MPGCNSHLPCTKRRNRESDLACAAHLWFICLIGWRVVHDPVNSKLKVVVLGAGGRLGAALVREFAATCEVAGYNHAQLDLADLDHLRAAISGERFDVLINAAALTNVDYCEDHRVEAMRLNAEAPRVLAEICREKHARFIHVSTDYVFDGEKRVPYTEEDPANAISVYGESKRVGELQVLEANDHALVIRVSWVFGPDRPSFVDAILKRARTEEKVAAVADKFSTPTYTYDIAELLRPFFDRETGAAASFISQTAESAVGRSMRSGRSIVVTDSAFRCGQPPSTRSRSRR